MSDIGLASNVADTPVITMEPRAHPAPNPDRTAIAAQQRRDIDMLAACCIGQGDSRLMRMRHTPVTPCFTTAALDCVNGDLDSDEPRRGIAKLKSRSWACLVCGPQIVPVVVFDCWLIASYPLRVCAAGVWTGAQVRHDPEPS